MLYKCNFCDPVTKRGEKPVKSIDTQKDLFLKDENGKYYHLNCFRLHLTRRKKLTDEETINQITEKLKIRTDLEVKENTEKDKFLKWIIDFYDGSLPTYFLKKLQNIREGNHESINEPITYETLLDIYQYMARYLQKLAATKKIENIAQRMNYDLAVVLGNYGDYKRFKRKQQAFSIESEDINKQIKVDNKLANIGKNKKNRDQTESDNDEEFDITDVIGELLL